MPEESCCAGGSPPLINMMLLSAINTPVSGHMALAYCLLCSFSQTQTHSTKQFHPLSPFVSSRLIVFICVLKTLSSASNEHISVEESFSLIRYSQVCEGGQPNRPPHTHTVLALRAWRDSVHVVSPVRPGPAWRGAESGECALLPPPEKPRIMDVFVEAVKERRGNACSTL